MVSTGFKWFCTSCRERKIGLHNLRVKQQGEVKEIAVPILEEKNLGNQMAVDEKNHQWYMLYHFEQQKNKQDSHDGSNS